MVNPTRVSNETLPCNECGSLFIRKSRNGPIPKRCPECAWRRISQFNAEYRAAASARAAQTKLCAVCEDCMGEFERSRKGPLPGRCPGCATRRHRDRSRDRQRRTGDQPPVECRDCSAAIQQPEVGRWRLRCDSCIKSNLSGYVESWYRRNPEKLAEKRRNHKQRRRAAKRSAEYERFSFREVCERDEWICGICAYRIDPLVKHPDPRSASLDHVIPLSLGGTHTRANVRLACLKCNVDRGNRMEPAIPN